MHISQRLQTVINATSGRVLADIGADHGYVAIEAVRSGRVSRALACDVNAGPLDRAAANVIAFGLTSRIELRQGSGLEPVAPGEADCITIAGMGGMLMVDILRRGIATALAADRIILQPQSDTAAVRRFIHDLGFRISSEHMLHEGRFYTVICCEPGLGARYTEAGYAFGALLIESRDAVLKQYLEKKLMDYEKILRIHENADVRHKLNICLGVLECF